MQIGKRKHHLDKSNWRKEYVEVDENWKLKPMDRARIRANAIREKLSGVRGRAERLGRGLENARVRMLEAQVKIQKAQRKIRKGQARFQKGVRTFQKEVRSQTGGFGNANAFSLDMPDIGGTSRSRKKRRSSLEIDLPEV